MGGPEGLSGDTSAATSLVLSCRYPYFTRRRWAAALDGAPAGGPDGGPDGQPVLHEYFRGTSRSAGVRRVRWIGWALVTSVLDRLVAPGITEDRARWWIESGAVSVDGNLTTIDT